MKILLVSTSDLGGGANIAAYRLLQALQSVQADVTMVVRFKFSDNPAVRSISSYPGRHLPKGSGFLDKFPDWMLNSPNLLSWGQSWNDLNTVIREERPDIIHLHWGNNGFVGIKAISKLNIPLVWTLHDMWAFTGGCHYAQVCNHFEQECSDCPILKPSIRKLQPTRWVHRRKQRLFKDKVTALISPSKWLAAAASRSSLFRDQDIQIIPYCIDATVFNPDKREQGRSFLNLQPQEKAVLFINPDQLRKGKPYIPEIIRHLVKESDISPTIVFLGSSLEVETTARVIKVPALKDSTAIAGIYAACDVMILPALEDNFPNVVIEALTCGTPVAAFDTGGIPEMLHSPAMGYTVPIGDTASLASFTKKFLKYDTEQKASVREHSLIKFSQSKVANEHIELYRKMAR